MKKPFYFRSISTNRIIETNNPEFYKGADYESIKSTTGALLKQEETRGDLLELLKPGQTVYSQIVSVSASGMQRSIKFLIVNDNKLVNITRSVGRLLDYKMHKNGGVVVNGCGMDMCFSTVYDLGRVLWEGSGSDKDPGYFLNSEII